MATQNAINTGLPIEVANGGTSTTTLTDHGVLVGSGTSAITALTVGADGYVLLGATGADPAFAALTSTGGTVSFTPGANTLNLESTASGGLTWNEVTGTTQAMDVDNGYICNNGSQVVCTLPDTAALGSVIRIAGKGAGGWKIAQNAGETIYWDASTATTTGITGYLESTDKYDAVELVCMTADTSWVVVSSKGNITIA